MANHVDSNALKFAQRKPSLWISRSALVLMASTLLAIIILMLTPVRQLPIQGPASLQYLVHTVLYFCLVLPSVIAWPKYIVPSAILAFLTGICIEFVQPYFHRGFEISDLVANVAGILLAMAAGTIFRRVIGGSEKPNQC